MAFGATTFLDLPLEIRLMVYNMMLEEIPTGYAYTPETLYKPRTYTLRSCHQILLLNRHISDEYAQAFFERTTIFFYVQFYNAKESSIWNFPTHLQSIRQCKIYVDMNDNGTNRLEPCSREEFEERMRLFLRSMQKLRTINITMPWGISPALHPNYEPSDGLLELLKAKTTTESITFTAGQRLTRIRRLKGKWVKVDFEIPGYYSEARPETQKV